MGTSGSSGGDSLAGVGEDTVDMTVETTEEEEWEENHDEEVTDEDVITTVSEVKPELGRTDRELAGVVGLHLAVGDPGLVDGVAGLQFQEAGDVPGGGEDDHWQDVQTEGRSTADNS